MSFMATYIFSFDFVDLSSLLTALLQGLYRSKTK